MTTEGAALRLLPHPRCLLIVNAKEAGSIENQNFRENTGHVTVYLLQGTRTLMNRLFAKTDLNMALSYGSRRELRGFMKQRLGVYDAIESVGEVDTNLIAELRMNIVVGARNRR